MLAAAPKSTRATYHRLKSTAVRHGRRLRFAAMMRLPGLLLAFCLTVAALTTHYKYSSLNRKVRDLSFQSEDEDKGMDVRSLVSSTWPIYGGYDIQTTKKNNSHPDMLLIAKLLAGMTMLRAPIFRQKGEVETWKFPKIIHQTWVSEEIPKQTAVWVKKWLEIHPEWTYMFWTDESSREFIKQYYPSLLAPYDSWTIPVQRADMFRYIALFAFGGVYADLDMEPLKSLNDVRAWSSCILSREPDLQTFIMSNFMNNYANNYTFTCNAFFACRANHPFMFYMISRTVQKSPFITEKPCPLGDTIACSGPWLMSLVFAYYRRSIPEDIRNKYPEFDVICPEYEWFLPTFDNTRLDLVQKNCKDKNRSYKQRETCRIYEEERNKTNTPQNYSYTDHHWFHSYHYDVTKHTVNIYTVTKITNYQDGEFTIMM